MPFPSTRMIPEGWSAHHAQFMPTSMNGTVVVTDPNRSAPGPLDPATGTRPPAEPFVVFGGPEDPNPAWRAGTPARIQRLLSDQQIDLAGQETTTRQYLVQLPVDVPVVELGYRFRVNTAPNDLDLVDAILVAVDVQHGSERFTRDVVCTHNQSRPNGSA